MEILANRGTAEDQLERWLGAEHVQRISRDMKDWYGPPIALGGVPGNVMCYGGGDFRGPIDAGKANSARDIFLAPRFKALRRELNRQVRQAAANVGFTSLSDLIAAISQGQRRDFQWQKTSGAGVAGATTSLWRVVTQPAAGANGSAAPGGRALNDTTTGTIAYANPGGTDTLHFVGAEVFASLAGSSLLLYDRLFDVAKTMNSTATEAVTGVPTRYQSVTPTDMDWSGGNFLAIEVGTTALANTAHNWVTCLYRDEDGNDSQTLPTVTGNAAAIANRLDHPLGSWFCPLATGDRGIKDLDQMQCSALVATGEINFVIGHPIAMMACPVANMVCIRDGINTAMSLARIFDDAALALLDVSKPTTTSTIYSVGVLAAYS